MAWFKKGSDEKEKSKLPELPELPGLPSLSPKTPIKEDSTIPQLPEKNALPSFPSSPTGEKISHEAVKDAINQPETPQKPELVPSFTPNVSHRPLEPAKHVQEMRIPEKRVPRVAEIESKTVGRSTKVEPIFVRIDKFQEALSKFEDIKKNVLEIEDVLRNIKEVKKREEAELQEWEHEIQQAKTKLDQIDRTIFKKLD